jgi:hypothetical protein
MSTPRHRPGGNPSLDRLQSLATRDERIPEPITPRRASRTLDQGDITKIASLGLAWQSSSLKTTRKKRDSVAKPDFFPPPPTIKQVRVAIDDAGADLFNIAGAQQMQVTKMTALVEAASHVYRRHQLELRELQMQILNMSDSQRRMQWKDHEIERNHNFLRMYKLILKRVSICSFVRNFQMKKLISSLHADVAVGARASVAWVLSHELSCYTTRVALL